MFHTAATGTTAGGMRIYKLSPRLGSSPFYSRDRPRNVLRAYRDSVPVIRARVQQQQQQQLATTLAWYRDKKRNNTPPPHVYNISPSGYYFLAKISSGKYPVEIRNPRTKDRRRLYSTPVPGVVRITCTHEVGINSHFDIIIIIEFFFLSVFCKKTKRNPPITATSEKTNNYYLNLYFKENSSFQFADLLERILRAKFICY